METLENVLWLLLEKPVHSEPFNHLSPHLSTSQDILERSHGVIPKPETLNYRTQLPESGGILCPNVFGPIPETYLADKDPKEQQAYLASLPVGDTLQEPTPRNQRFGHVELDAPILHPWFIYKARGFTKELFGLSFKALTELTHNEAYIILHSKHPDFPVGQTFAERDLEDHKQQGLDIQLIPGYKLGEFQAPKHQVVASYGTEALQKHLQNQGHPTPFFWTTLPILPPDLRPIFADKEPYQTASDINELYRRVINRNNRLRRLKELNAPEIIVRNELRMLQEAVGSLFYNGHTAKTLLHKHKRPYSSLHDLLFSKETPQEPWKMLQYLDQKVAESPQALQKALPAKYFQLLRYLEAVGIRFW